MIYAVRGPSGIESPLLVELPMSSVLTFNERRGLSVRPVLRGPAPKVIEAEAPCVYPGESVQLALQPEVIIDDKGTGECHIEAPDLQIVDLLHQEGVGEAGPIPILFQPVVELEVLEGFHIKVSRSPSQVLVSISEDGAWIGLELIDCDHFPPDGLARRAISSQP